MKKEESNNSNREYDLNSNKNNQSYLTQEEVNELFPKKRKINFNKIILILSFVIIFILILSLIYFNSGSLINFINKYFGKNINNMTLTNETNLEQSNNNTNNPISNNSNKNANYSLESGGPSGEGGSGGGTCTPNCAGKTCGNDGCSGSCGSCSSGYICNSTGQCISGSCTPSKTCSDYSGLCGTNLSNGCNNVLDCSNNCQSGEVCLSGTCVSTEINLPETFDTTYSLPNCGSTETWTVSDTGNPTQNGINLQNTINNASLCDIIILDAGTTYYGNFRLPNKTGEGWIYIISSDLASLTERNRVKPEDSVHMPKIKANPGGANGYSGVISQFGAHNYRFAGIEFVTDGPVYNLILLGMNVGMKEALWNMSSRDHYADTIEKLPYNITFDRCYIHSANDTVRSRAGILANGRYIAVIDSYISNMKDGSDAQAIWIYNGLGPYKIVNNYLEGTGENFMSGGTDPVIPNLVPSDFEIRGNYFYKPLYWKTDDPSYRGISWTIKNLFELKNAQRVLVDGNVFENSWVAGQTGNAIVLTPRNQNGNAPWSVIQDLIFTNNIIYHVGRSFAILGQDGTYPSRSGQTKRILIKNNFIYDLNRTCYGNTFLMIINTFPPDGEPVFGLEVKNNIFVHAGLGYGFIVFEYPGLVQADSSVFENNIFTHGNYGWSYGNNYSFTRYTRNSSFNNNLIIFNPLEREYSWYLQHFNDIYSGNIKEGTIDNVGFVDYFNNNYQLNSTSIYKNAGTDGKDIGPDYNAINVATACTLTGQCR